MNIGTFATTALKAGKSSTETLALVKQVFPGCETTIKGIYSYASKAGIKLGNRSTADPVKLAEALKMLEPVKTKKVKAA